MKGKDSKIRLPYVTAVTFIGATASPFMVWGGRQPCQPQTVQRVCFQSTTWVLHEGPPRHTYLLFKSQPQLTTDGYIIVVYYRVLQCTRTKVITDDLLHFSLLLYSTRNLENKPASFQLGLRCQQSPS